MRISQIVYKVDDLDKAVEKARKDGYIVEYGQKKDPYNAFIYFPNGPYIELMKSTGVPGFVKFFMRLFKRKELAKRFTSWDNEKEGPLGIGIEVETRDIDRIKDYLEARNIKTFKIPIRRVGTDGKDNICYCLFPENTKMPFYVTKYRAERPKDKYVHENGVLEVEGVDISLAPDEYSVVEGLFNEFGLWNDLGGTLSQAAYTFNVRLKKGETT